MKKKLLVLAMLGFSTLAVNAGEFTVDDSCSREYLKNNGYSDSAIEIVERSRARAMGEAYNEEHTSLFKDRGGWFGNFLRYLDPALDRNTFMNYDIEYYSRFDDM